MLQRAVPTRPDADGRARPSYDSGRRPAVRGVRAFPSPPYAPAHGWRPPCARRDHSSAFPSGTAAPAILSDATSTIGYPVEPEGVTPRPAGNAQGRPYRVENLSGRSTASP